MKHMFVLLAALLVGCGTVSPEVGGNGNEVRAGFKLNILGSSTYQRSAWVNSQPLLWRWAAVSADSYLHAWKETPVQSAIAHLAAIYVSDKETWDERVQGWIDDIRGKEDAPAPVMASDLTEAEIQLLSSGAGNTINLNYTYMPGATRPDVVVQNNGNDNTFNVTIGPIEEEE